MKQSIAMLSVLLLVMSLIDGSTAAPAPPPQTTPAVPDNYVIGPGDQVEVDVFVEYSLVNSASSCAAVLPEAVTWLMSGRSIMPSEHPLAVRGLFSSSRFAWLWATL